MKHYQKVLYEILDQREFTKILDRNFKQPLSGHPVELKTCTS